MMLLFFLVIAAGCVVIDLPLLKQKGRPRDRLVWVLFWILGIAAVYCSLYKIKVPSPLYLVMFIYKPVNSFFEMWFH
ncbi:hypothetical protein A3844_09860 [Paenibacillus helianthi]|uniref:Uncharacterized protein n=1 Tax=Paenibacillus helianthi TaxID=1349432 RepID=A0ABX3ETA2_9BACL|nr:MULTISPECIES: hypothetical protein [Paenibacillus]OKP87705.1 hypothetical protein A3844_09860 [Paenibacillus helianthi]OKP93370.1 hypothetical protein A3848_05190 [Paenibacillus sp. P32E]